MYSFLETMFLVEHEHVTSMLQEYAGSEEGRELQRIIATTALSGTQHVFVKEWLPALIVATLQDTGYHQCDSIHTIFDPQTEQQQVEQMLHHPNYTSALSERDLLLVPTAQALVAQARRDIKLGRRDTPSHTRGEEVILTLANGYILATAGEAYQRGAYVCIRSEEGEELLYWDKEEWREPPEEVMGAILGALLRFSQPTGANRPPHTSTNQ